MCHREVGEEGVQRVSRREGEGNGGGLGSKEVEFASSFKKSFWVR